MNRPNRFNAAYALSFVGFDFGDRRRICSRKPAQVRFSRRDVYPLARLRHTRAPPGFQWTGLTLHTMIRVLIDYTSSMAYPLRWKQNIARCPDLFGENREAGETPARARHCNWESFQQAQAQPLPFIRREGAGGRQPISQETCRTGLTASRIERVLYVVIGPRLSSDAGLFYVPTLLAGEYVYDIHTRITPNTGCFPFGATPGDLPGNLCPA